MNTLTKSLVLATVILALNGCEKKGPAEEAGREIDKAISGLNDQIKEAGRQIENAVK